MSQRIALVTAALALTVAPALRAEPSHPHLPPGPPPPPALGPVPHALLHRLDLTATQRAQAEEAHGAYLEAVEADRSTLARLQEELDALLQGEPVDAATVLTTVDDRSAILADHARARARLHMAILSILTGEQRERLVELRPRHPGHLRHPEGPGAHRPTPPVPPPPGEHP